MQTKKGGKLLPPLTSNDDSDTGHKCCYPGQPDTGGRLAHAQAVDTRPREVEEDTSRLFLQVSED